MKNKTKFLGIIALSVIIGFSMTPCTNNDGDGGLTVTGGGGSNVAI